MPRARLALAALLVAGPALAQHPAGPPAAKKVPHRVELHGETRTDDYFWLKDKSDPEVVKHLEAENSYTAAATARLGPLRDALYKEMLGRVKQTDRDVPVREHGYWYYSRTEEGKQYPIYCRKKGTLFAPEEIILDANELAKGHKFLAVGERRVSDDGNLLAFTADVTGSREYELSVKDLRTGNLVETRFAKSPGVAWAADSKILFYLTEDDARRAHKVRRHAVGRPLAEDVLVYEEKDELFWLDLSRSRDGKYVFHTSMSYTSGEQRYLPADNPAGEWKTVLPREEGHEYTADHRDGKFYIRTNKGAANFRVVTCPVEKTDPANWTDLVGHDRAVLVEGLTLFKDFAVVSERQDARPHLRVVDLRTGLGHRVEFPEPVYDAEVGPNPEFAAPAVRFAYSSPVTPPSVYEYDPATGGRKLFKRTDVPGGYDPAAYRTERVYATAPDGVRVPVSLVYREGRRRDGSAACLLTGYGSYGVPMTTEFDPNVFSLLDRGVVYARAHVRGGNDLGRKWYDDGKLLNKKNTFTDFIACADHLVNQKYCARGRLAVEGESAGGLLVGAVLNRRPDLCKAAVLRSPFVDLINTMSDEALPLTVQEFRQWGNPREKAEYDYMKTYCPYSNLRAAAYPATLVLASLNDSQVLFHEPAKYVAKMRALKTDSNPLLLKCNMDAGHSGASGRYDRLKEEAFVTAFVLDQVGAGPTGRE
jgi:oligopeptidase B